MAAYPPALRRLIDAFLILPGIGRRTAERFAFSLLEGNPSAARELADAISRLHDAIVLCANCGQFTDNSPCSICTDTRREASQLCIVADSRAMHTIEQTGAYRGRYFILGELTNPLEGTRPHERRINALQNRLASDGIKEIILALGATLEGDTTVLYLMQQLKTNHITLTRLARGLPTGSRLEYADEQTVTEAFVNRRPVALPPNS